MKDHLSYLRYVIRHKWHVFKACARLGVPFRLAVTHDLSKFSPAEWGPYVHTFYNKDGSGRYDETPEFNQAWNHHQKANKHHWQYWILTMDRGEEIVLRMPLVYVREMVADWSGAGMAITGDPNPLPWYTKNRDKMKLHPGTRDLVEGLLELYWGKA